jgi:hypothetical protein
VQAVDVQMNRFAKFFALSPADRKLLIEAWIVLAGMRVAVRKIALVRLCKLASRSRSMRAGDRALPSVEAIVTAVDRASSVIPGGHNCLLRALTAALMLRRANYESELKIGVSKPPGGEFGAHAWVEIAGKIVIGEFESGRYVTLAGPAVWLYGGAPH